MRRFKALRFNPRWITYKLIVLTLFLLLIPYLILCLKNRSFSVAMFTQHVYTRDPTLIYIRNNSNVCFSRLPRLTKRDDKSTQTPCSRNPSIDVREENRNILHRLEVLTQQHIYNMQNPFSCQDHRLLVCSVPSGPGLGSLVHLLSECLILALGTNRTMVAQLSGWWYHNIEDVFKPLSSSCNGRDISNAVDLKDEKQLTSDQVLTMNVFNERVNSSYVPFNIPRKIAHLLECSHSDPNAWWMGQIAKYLIRFSPRISEKINAVKQAIRFTHPIVGIHVRRTDKKIEGNFFRLESYMAYVERWYNCNYHDKGNDFIRKVYIATDEPDVIKEAIQRYRNYTFIYDLNYLQHRTAWWNRYSSDGTMGVLTDLQLLKESDYFVGTYSSNIGRLIYELKQSEKDSTYDSISLDYKYYFHNGEYPHHIAIENYVPHKRNELNLTAGDIISADASLPFPTQNRGYNKNTKSFGTYSINRVRIFIKAVDFPGFT